MGLCPRNSDLALCLLTMAVESLELDVWNLVQRLYTRVWKFYMKRFLNVTNYKHG